MKTLFLLVLSGALGMGAVFGKVGERKHFLVGPAYSMTTPTPNRVATETPLLPTQTSALPEALCVIDWSMPSTAENLVTNSACYNLMYYDPVSRTYPGAPPFCPPNNSAWEQFFDWFYLDQWCYDNPPTQTPTVTPIAIDPYPPPSYP